MSGIIKRDLFLYKRLLPFVCFILSVIIIFLFVMYVNNWDSDELILQMIGVTIADFNPLILGNILIVNSSIFAYTIYIYAHDLRYSSETVFLRVSNVKIWLISKLTSLFIINLTNLIILVIVYNVSVITIKGELGSLSFITFIQVLFLKYLYQLLLITLYNFTKKVYLILGVILIVIPIFLKNLGIIYIDLYKMLGNDILSLFMILLICLIIMIINFKRVKSFNLSDKKEV